MRIALGVTAVAVDHVVVDEVGDDQAGVLFLGPLFDKRLGVGVVAGVNGFGDAPVTVDVLDFADGIDGDVFFDKAFEDGFFVRQVGEILAVLGALEGAGLADEGAGDDAADAQGVAEAAGDVAVAVQFGDGDDFLVGGDLEDAVGGGVADERSGFEVFGAEFVDDGGAAGGLVADQLAAGFLLEGGDQVGREGVFKREVVEPGIHFEAGDFPVAGNGVLAVGHFAHGAAGGDGIFLGGNAIDGLDGAVMEQGGDVAEAHLLQGRDIEPAGGSSEMGKSRSTGIAVFGGVGGGADAHGVENDQDGFHLRPSFCTARGAAGVSRNLISNAQ